MKPVKLSDAFVVLALLAVLVMAAWIVNPGLFKSGLPGAQKKPTTEITGKRVETVEEGSFYSQGSWHAVTIITDRKTKRDYMAIPGVGVVLMAQ